MNVQYRQGVIERTFVLAEGRAAGIWTLIFLALLLGGCASSEPQFKTGSAKERAQTRVDLGMSYLQHQQWQFAEEEFEKALALDSRADGAHYGLGLVAVQRQDEKVAKQHLSRAVSLNPDNFPAVNDYAAVLCRSGETNKGMGVLESAGSKANTEPRLSRLNAWGVCKLAAKEYRGAEAVYSRILAAQPEFEQALLAMAEIRFRSRKYLSARAFIERYFATGALSARALLRGAEIEQMLDNAGQRDDYLQRLEQVFPTSPQASTARDKYR